MDILNQSGDPKVAEEMNDVIRNIQPQKRAKVWKRDEWGGQPPTHQDPLEHPVMNVILSRTETDTCSSTEECKQRCRDIQTVHMNEGEPDIKHNFLVGGDGAIYVGRGYFTAGPHYPTSPKRLEKLSKVSIDIALIGRMENESTQDMMKAAADCMSIGTIANYIRRRFALFWVANNEIQHFEAAMGEQFEALNK